MVRGTETGLAEAGEDLDGPTVRAPGRAHMTLVEGARQWCGQRESTPRVDPLAHRETVVRRLLDLGISPATLRVVLPDFRALVDRLAPRR
jgi:hypothetical protein